jgi:hypothetical protein
VHDRRPRDAHAGHRRGDHIIRRPTGAPVSITLTISERANVFICNPATLAADWPAYMRRVIDASRARLAR